MISKSSPLNNFSEFPIRIESKKIKKQLFNLNCKDIKSKAKNSN